MPDFYQTGMGRTFFDYTMPALVKQLQRLNENLEKLLAAQQQKPEDNNGRGP